MTQSGHSARHEGRVSKSSTQRFVSSSLMVQICAFWLRILRDGRQERCTANPAPLKASGRFIVPIAFFLT